jgi:hypothetical protein
MILALAAATRVIVTMMRSHGQAHVDDVVPRERRRTRVEEV